MPDSDDLLIDNSLSVLLEKALETKADLVVADFLIMNDEEIAATKDIPQKEAIFKEKTGEKLFLEDLNPHQCYIWRTLFRKDFIINHKMSFVPGVCYQDVPFAHECYIKAKKCLRTHWILNIYRTNRVGSASYSFTEKKAKDFCIVIAKTWELTRIEGLSPQVLKRLKENNYVSFTSLSYSVLFGIKESSRRVAILKYLKQLVPDLAFENGTKEKILTFIFRNVPQLFFPFLWCNVKIHQILK